MIFQFSSTREREEYGEHVVRIVADNLVGAKNSDVLDRINERLPDGLVAKAPDSEGYGKIAYVPCQSAEEKRKAEIALFGEERMGEIADAYRKWLSVHSYIYYELGKNVVKDLTWDKKARNLARLQNVHGTDIGSWQNEAFEGLDGKTGMSLPRTQEIKDKANELVDE